jgi:two-component system sensor histidine kinase AtoS
MRDIVARIDALNELIQDLLTFARPKPPRLAPVNLRQLIDDAIVMLRRDPVGSSLLIDVNGDAAEVSVDPDLIRATMLNLLLNSAQAMNGQGRIAITSAVRKGMWSIEIADNGPGVPAEIREQILEPFFTTKARGGGLGLPIAKRVAEMHRGRLTLDFPSSGGTAATITAPVAPALHER